MSLIYFQFLCDMTNVVSVRLILQQPSPVWKEFKIEELKLFRISSVSLFFFSANEKIVNTLHSILFLIYHCFYFLIFLSFQHVFILSPISTVYFLVTLRIFQLAPRAVNYLESEQITQINCWNVC